MRYSEREIRDLLTPKDTPAPPAGLAERIKDEIPGHLEMKPAPAAVLRFPRRSYQRTLLLAASLAATLGGAFLAYRVQRGSPAPEPLVIREGPRFEQASADRLDAAGRTFTDSVAVPSSGGEESGPAPAAKRDAAEPAAAARSEGRASPGNEERLRALGYTENDALASLADSAADVSSAKSASAVEGTSEKESPLSQPAGADESFRPDSAEHAAAGAPMEITLHEAAALEAQKQALAPESLPVPRPARAPAAPAAEGALSLRAEGSPRVELKARRIDSEASLREQPAAGRVSTFRPDVVPTRRANPNDAPYDDVYFRDYGTNPFIDTEDDALSTFGLDVDTASYAVMRRFLNDGHLPEPDAIRPEELINYFDYGDAPPSEGDFAIHAEGAPSPFGEGESYYLLRFHLRARELDTSERRPAHLTFVVDTSGSMARENRLGLVQDALGLLVDQLREDDRVALVSYGSRAHVVLDATADRERIRRALAQLRPEGSTNAEEGLRLGYELAVRERRKGTINRVILCSDGVANVGSTSAASILEGVAAYARRGVELTTVGFGMGNFNDVLLEQLADRGNGRYAYVDTLDEARRIFVEDLTGTLQTIAAEARVQVEFNPQVVSRYRLVGYENRDIADRRFRDDTVDAGEIGAGHAVTALYEVKLREGRARGDEVATLRLRYGSIISGEMVETARTVTGEDFAKTWEKSSRALRLTSLVGELGEILKQSFWARTGDLDRVFRMAQAVAVEYPGDADVAEFVSLAGKAARYQP